MNSLFLKPGGIPPYITSDPNDPRIQAYRDSLSLYKKGIAVQNFWKNPNVIKRDKLTQEGYSKLADIEVQNGKLIPYDKLSIQDKKKHDEIGTKYFEELIPQLQDKISKELEPYIYLTRGSNPSYSDYFANKGSKQSKLLNKIHPIGYKKLDDLPITLEAEQYAPIFKKPQQEVKLIDKPQQQPTIVQKPEPPKYQGEYRLRDTSGTPYTPEQVQQVDAYNQYWLSKNRPDKVLNIKLNK